MKGIRVQAESLNELGDDDPSRMPLLDHLRELRQRLMRSVIAVGLALLFVMGCPRLVVDAGGDPSWAIGLVEPVYDWLTAPFNAAMLAQGKGGELAIVNSPFEGIYTWLRVAVGTAGLLASPVIAFQIWAFIAPGLYQTERRHVAPLSLASVMLFITGALFAYYAIFPLAFPFFLSVLDAKASLSIEGYLSAITRIMLAFGICFQLPVGVFFLSRLGLIDHLDMIRGFRYAVVVIVATAAVLTPPEVATQIALAVPLTGLYGVGIIIARFASTKVRVDQGA